MNSNCDQNRAMSRLAIGFAAIRCVARGVSLTVIVAAGALFPKLAVAQVWISAGTQVSWTAPSGYQGYEWQAIGGGNIIAGGGPQDDFMVVDTTGMTAGTWFELWCFYWNWGQNGNITSSGGYETIGQGQSQYYLSVGPYTSTIPYGATDHLYPSGGSSSSSYSAWTQNGNLVMSPDQLSVLASGIGSCYIDGDLPGDQNYYDSNDVQIYLTVVQATPTVGSTFVNKSVNGTYTVQGSDLAAVFSNPYTSSGITQPTGTVTYAITGATGANASPTSGAVISGTVLQPGTYQIKATYPGDSNYNSTTVAATWTIIQLTTPTTFAAGTLSFTYNGSSQPVTITPTPSNATFSETYTGSGSTTYGPSTTAPTNGGTYTVSAAANGNYSGTASFTETIVQAGQAAVTSANVGPGAWSSTLTASAAGGSSSGAYVFQLVGGGTAPGGAVTSGGVISATGSGTVLFNVYRASDSNYLQSGNSPTYTATFTASAQSTPTSANVGPTAWSNTLTASPAGGNGTGSYVFQLAGGTAPGGAVAAGGVISATGSGTVLFNVYRNGDTNYQQSSNSVTYTATFTAAAQTTAVTSSGGSVAWSSSFVASGSGGNGSGTYAFQLVSGGTAPGGAVSSTGTISATGSGTVLFQVQRTADSNYQASAWYPVSSYYTMTFTSATQGVVSVSPTSTNVTTGIAATFTASGGSGTGAYTWSLPASASGSATGASNSITFSQPGSYTVSVYKAADANYLVSGTVNSSVTAALPQYLLTVNASPSNGGTVSGVEPTRRAPLRISTPVPRAATCSRVGRRAAWWQMRTCRRPRLWSIRPAR